MNTGTPAGTSGGAGAAAGGSGGQATPHPGRQGSVGGQAARLSNATHFEESGVHSSTEDCDAVSQGGGEKGVREGGTERGRGR